VKLPDEFLFRVKDTGSLYLATRNPSKPSKFIVTWDQPGLKTYSLEYDTITVSIALREGVWEMVGEDREGI